MRTPKKPFATIFVLWPNEESAKEFRITTERSLSMLIGSRRAKLEFDRYDSEGDADYWRVTTASSGLNGFYIVRNNDTFCGEPSDGEKKRIAAHIARFIEESRTERTGRNPTTGRT